MHALAQQRNQFVLMTMGINYTKKNAMNMFIQQVAEKVGLLESLKTLGSA